MRPTEVTDEQIIQAGIQLESEQARVTGFALRRLIGAGTPTRLIKVWTAHKEGTEPAPAPAEEAQPLPGDIEPALKAATDQVAASLRQLVVGLNGHCQREAKVKVAKAEQDADAKCTLYLEELADASTQIENAENQNQTLERHAQQLGNELNAAHERIAALTGELALANERLERCTADLNKSREQEAGAKQAASIAEQALQALEREVEDAKQTHAEEIGRHQEALSGEKEKRVTLEKKLAQVQLTCDALSEQSNSKTTQLASANAKINGLEERLVDQRIRVDEQHTVLSSQRQSIAHLERQIEQLMEERKQQLDGASPEAGSDESKG